nr:phosphotransferase [Jiangella gansuensis]
MLAQAARLLADGATVPVGWCHGDLGFSNVIVGDAGTPTLVDWEHAARLPLAGDLAKVAVMSPDQDAVVRQISAEAGLDDVGERAGRRSVADQLALVVLRELSWWERRRATAAASGRLAPFERGVRRRLALLDRLFPSP